MITVQAGPNTGPNLVEVLTQLGDESRGSFIEWGAGSGRSKEREIAEAFTAAMTSSVAAEVGEGMATLESLEYDSSGIPTIPLNVLDGENLDRLRRAGIEFNIDNGGGVLIREAYMLESPDLLSPEIQVEKETVLNLINLYSILSVTGTDAESLQDAVIKAIAAISGEDPNPDDDLGEIVEKQLGIQFRSDLLSFDINFLGSLNTTELLGLAKRFQDAAVNLNQFYDRNISEFDTEPSVWMQVSLLP